MCRVSRLLCDNLVSRASGSRGMSLRIEPKSLIIKGKGGGGLISNILRMSSTVLV